MIHALRRASRKSGHMIAFARAASAAAVAGKMSLYAKSFWRF